MIVISLVDKDKVEHIEAKKSENFSDWYTQVLVRSEFIDYTDVSGCIAFRPASYWAWEQITSAVDSQFKKVGVSNVYFPMFIPEKLLEREGEHFKGFNPEVAWVTQAGDTKLEDKLAVRPTSETIMYQSYSKWIRSWRDLPIRYNQWNSVVRWEFKHPTPLLRSREYLWNEGHSAFATSEEAQSDRDVILGIYERVLKEYLALPGIKGTKSDNEKFVGAEKSYSIEHLMPDGFAIQGPDFHFDGQKFSKVFGIKFLDKDGKSEYAWQVTFAISTRELGVMVATHGDDKGLVMPPRLAHVQIVIVPIYRKDNTGKVNAYAKAVYDELKYGFRVRLDDREGYSPGFKFNEWEMKGVPVRIEIGERDMSANMVTIVRRDTGEKEQVKVGSVALKSAELIEEIHRSLYQKAVKFLQDNTHSVSTYEEFKKVLKEKGGMLHSPWCGSPDCESKIKAETGAKITNIPFDQGRLSGKCVYCGEKAKHMVNFARSY